MFEDDSEAEATILVKETIKFLQNVIDHLESIKRRTKDFHLTKIGKKHRPGEAIN